VLFYDIYYLRKLVILTPLFVRKSRNIFFKGEIMRESKKNRGKTTGKVKSIRSQLEGARLGKAKDKLTAEELNAIYQQLTASEQQLRAVNEQLKADEQQLKASNQQLQATEQQLRAANQQLLADQEELGRLNRDLDKRIKELNCLYGLSHLAERRDITLEEIFQGLGELIPPSWQYPEITAVRITFNGFQFKTDNFRKTAWFQSADIKIHNQKAGTIEVCYRKKRPVFDEGPFTNEERNLLNALAERLGDIIERKQAEKALAEEHNLLRTLIDNMPDYIYVKNAQSHFVLNNVAHQRSIGVTSQEELKGKTDLDVFPKKLAAQYYADEKKIMRSGKALLNREEMFKDAEDNDQWVLATKVPLRDSMGKIMGLVGISRDITARKMAEEALKAANQQLKASEQQLRAANEQLKADEQQLKASNQQLRATEQQLQAANEQLKADEQQLRAVNQQLHIEINERKQAEEALKASNQQLKASEEELRNKQKQLRALTTKLSSIEESERRHIAESIHDSVIQPLVFLDVKVKSLLEIAKDNSSVESFNQMRGILAELIEKARSFTFDLSYPVLNELGLETAIDEWVKTEIEEKHKIAAKFKGDGQCEDLEQNMSNFLFKCIKELLINVVKHAQAGEVKVSLAKDKEKNRMIVCVEDNGRGFSADRCKEKYDKLSGYGLFNIHERLSYLGGDINIESKAFSGSRVVLTVPLSKESLK